ncbi:MAG: hypothetical protein J2P48_02505 [Alphaproteobacteria bacterium]|nr:hypothetical protein [Alphaproteobacteria bacterium]
MHSVRGVITAVQEGRFRLLTDSGQVLLFVLSYKAATEPQDLPLLKITAAHVKVECVVSDRLIAAVAHRIQIEE